MHTPHIEFSPPPPQLRDNNLCWSGPYIRYRTFSRMKQRYHVPLLIVGYGQGPSVLYKVTDHGMCPKLLSFTKSLTASEKISQQSPNHCLSKTSCLQLHIFKMDNSDYLLDNCGEILKYLNQIWSITVTEQMRLLNNRHKHLETIFQDINQSRDYHNRTRDKCNREYNRHVARMGHNHQRDRCPSCCHFRTRMEHHATKGAQETRSRGQYRGEVLQLLIDTRAARAKYP